jgi:HSP20 family molecular chaperone IbpA
MKRAAKSAGKVVVLENGDLISAEIEAVQSLIRQRAFELSQRPDHSREQCNWIAAESEMISVPPAEVIEKEGMIEARFGLAGVNPEDVNVLATSDQILVKSESGHRHESHEGTVHLCDFKSAAVFRTITLPAPIDVKSIRVSAEDGILHLTAAREERARSAAAATSTKRATTRKAPAKKTKNALRE